MSQEFSPKVRQEILERDSIRGMPCCVRCSKPSRQIHHIDFRSHGGGNGKRNGCVACYDCHQKGAHADDRIRRWFEEWRDRNLDLNGDLKDPLPDWLQYGE
ncbi:MAG TPA: HNH endonuclease [Sporolactobacillaceae bacterium]|nr:HNH endonuclease [Sporolactobacillaceae bacterium]